MRWNDLSECVPLSSSNLILRENSDESGNECEAEKEAQHLPRTVSFAAQLVRQDLEAGDVEERSACDGLQSDAVYYCFIRIADYLEETRNQVCSANRTSLQNVHDY